MDHIMTDEHAQANGDGNDQTRNAGTSTSTSTPPRTLSPDTSAGAGAGQGAEAGPSRRRRSASPAPGTLQAGDDNNNSISINRPASPSNVLPGPTPEQAPQSQSDTTPSASAPTPPPPSPRRPYLDLATYPTQTLLRMLASLLQQIASANDQLRPEISEDQDEDGGGGGMDDGGSTSSGTRSRASSTPHTHSGVPSSTSTPALAQPPALAQVQALSNPNLNPAHPSPTTALFSDSTPPSGPSKDKDEPPTPNHANPNPSKATESNLSRADASTQIHSPTTGRLETLFSASKTSLYHRSSLLSFHARHIPSISIEAYLLRILKYCPTTNEVFLGLLVYFDRMSRLGTPSGLGGAMKSGKGFAIDSFNVHRLIIAGVTVASKFFSDVFYTNSRYAKVGGLPPHELNQLELQFLLLNDFRLVIPYDEMQRYGNRLLGYWENKEADDREKEAAKTGVGVPSEDEMKAAFASAASARASASTPSATGNGNGNGDGHGTARSEGRTDDTTASTSTSTQDQSQSQTHIQTQSSATTPAHRDQDLGRPPQPVPSRGASFDAAAPPGGQGPPTNAITTA